MARQIIPASEILKSIKEGRRAEKAKPPIVRVDWYKCEGDEGDAVWCPLESLNLDQDSVQKRGVYIIWTPTKPLPVVYVGQVRTGTFGERFEDHLQDKTITRHGLYDRRSKKRHLYVTWAVVPFHQRNGVERFLANRLKPIEGENHPEVEPIPVNLPARRT